MDSHGTIIYRHLVDFYGELVGKYTIHGIGMGGAKLKNNNVVP